MRWLRSLIIYYGVLQILHLVVLGFGLLVYLWTGTFGFPAPPPVDGWSRQATFFLIGNGVIDAIIAAAALISVDSFLKDRVWAIPLGLICVTASLVSGAFFVLGTAMSGAWVIHPLNYFGLVLVFTPVLFLFVLLARAAAR